VTEEIVLRGHVNAGEYQYYRFYDMDPTFPLAIDLDPLSGDPDLIVGCMLNTTGTTTYHYCISSSTVCAYIILYRMCLKPAVVIFLSQYNRYPCRLPQ
jgi:hypothetical protein